MVKGLYTAFTGMVNEEKRLETLANNLANASTVGYKKEGATSQAFSDMLAYRIKDITVPTHVSGLGDVTLGVKIGETYTNYDQGSLQGQALRPDRQDGPGKSQEREDGQKFLVRNGSPGEDHRGIPRVPLRAGDAPQEPLRDGRFQALSHYHHQA